MTTDLRHHIVTSNGIRLHVAEQGQGPLVILVHGFPESWFSWRDQLPALAAAGFRVAAIDVRGYGRSSKPRDIGDYRMVRLVGDIVELVAALGEDQATLIGHDWGAPIVWNSALLRPDRFRGVAGISVPYNPPGGGQPPLATMRELAGDAGEFYIEYFQQPGRAEREIEKDLRNWLLGFYFSASGDAPAGTNIGIVPAGRELRDQMAMPSTLPRWLPESALDFYAAEFERSGLTGGLNRYRNVTNDFHDLAAFRGRPIELPALFIGGSRDGPTLLGAQAIKRFPETLPALTQSVILEGCGHWIQQERAAETNDLLIEFLREIHPTA